MNSGSTLSRRQLLNTTKAAALLAACERLSPAYARTEPATAGHPAELSGDTIDLTIAESHLQVDNKAGMAITVNGTLPGPLSRLR